MNVFVFAGLLFGSTTSTSTTSIESTIYDDFPSTTSDYSFGCIDSGTSDVSGVKCFSYFSYFIYTQCDQYVILYTNNIYKILELH